MNIKKWIILLSLPLLSVTATAMVGEVSGDTTCTIVSLIEKKQLKQTICSFEGGIGASMVYAVQQLSFETPNGDIISTVNNASFRFGDDGEMLNLEETITINDKPAEVIKLDSRTLKRLSQAKIDKYFEQSEPDFSNVLQCFKPIKESRAFCIPYALIYGYS